MWHQDWVPGTSDTNLGILKAYYFALGRTTTLSNLIVSNHRKLLAVMHFFFPFGHWKLNLIDQLVCLFDRYITWFFPFSQRERERKESNLVLWKMDLVSRTLYGRLRCNQFISLIDSRGSRTWRFHVKLVANHIHSYIISESSLPKELTSHH